MKQFKLRKKWLGNLALLLKSVGAVHGNQAYPSEVYASKKDIDQIRRELTKLGRKQGLSGKRLKMAVETEMLNLGPNESLKESIKPGHLLVDTKTIGTKTSFPLGTPD